MNKTGLKLNVFSGLVSSFWAGAASIVVLPFYLSILGAANFGLVVFSTTLLGLFAMLDLGFATSINRKVAQASTRADAGELRDLLRSLATIYWAVALTAGGATFIAAGPIARAFLTSPSIDPATVVDAVRVMAVMVVLRLPAGLYMGVLMGGQRIAVGNATALVITTLSTVGTLVVLTMTGGGVLTLLAWQTAVSALNVALLGWMAWRVVQGERRARFSLAQLRGIWKFSSVIAVTTVVGALILQLDKLVLAKFAPLEIVGEYGLAGFASRALLMLVGPVFSALYPRLTELLAGGDREMLIIFYRMATRGLSCVLTGASVFCLVNAHDLLFLWTRSASVADQLDRIAPILLIGTALNGIMYVPHAIQLAHGNARIAFWNNVAMIAFLAPALLLLVPAMGMTGAAMSWLGANVVNLLVGTWLTHRELLPGLAVRWLTIDVIAPILATGALPIAGVLLLPLAPAALGRLAMGAVLSGTGLALGLCLIPAIRRALTPAHWMHITYRTGRTRSASSLDR